MLSFKINETGNFVVIERIMGWSRTTTKLVEYKSDLSQCRVNRNPWQETTERNREWFEKYYRHKFVEFAEAVKNPKKVKRLHKKAFLTAFSKAHTAWCEANPDATREERKAAYAATYSLLEPKYTYVEETIPEEIR